MASVGVLIVALIAVYTLRIATERDRDRPCPCRERLSPHVDCGDLLCRLYGVKGSPIYIADGRCIRRALSEQIDWLATISPRCHIAANSHAANADGIDRKTPHFVD